MKSHTTVPNIVNNIVYVEPNYHGSESMYDKTGLNVFEQAPDLSDYCIFVNLEVEVLGRTINSEKGYFKMSWVSRPDDQNTTINFMEGTKIQLGDSNKHINSLTTNYTDTFLGDLKKIGGNTEMFGISSIDIAYNNFMVPEVTIEFIDVRGASLFSPRESQEGRDGALAEENYDTAGSFFQCFFTFPYPKFTLLVKGFYGQPVTYELTCSDFRARFDANNGNFACTAKFVGYAFSFLSDVMVNGVIAAPYSDFIGSEYWDSRNFTLPGINGSYVNMPKLAQLIEDANKILVEAEKEVDENGEYSQAEKDMDAVTYINNYIHPLYREFSDALRQIGDKFGKFTNKDAKTSKKTFQTYFESTAKINDEYEVVVDAYLLCPNQKSGMTFHNYIDSTSISEAGNVTSSGQWNSMTTHDRILSARNNLVGKINEFNGKYPDYQLPLPIDVYEQRSFKVVNFTKTKNNNVITEVKTLQNFDQTKPGYTNLRDRMKEELKTGLIVAQVEEEVPVDDEADEGFLDKIANLFRGKKKKKVKKYELFNAYENYVYGYQYSDNDLYSRIQEIIEIADSVSDDITDLRQKALDEAVAKKLGFWPSVENITRIIMAHFETFAYMIHQTGVIIMNEEPKRTASSLGASDDELADVPTDDTNTFVPPFPKVVKLVASEGQSTYEDAWVGDFSGDFREKDLVNGLLNGVDSAANIIGSTDENGFDGSYGSERMEKTIMPYPLAAVDLVAEYNPYVHLRSESLNSANKILGLMAVRAFNIISNNPIFSRVDFEKLGEYEVANLLDVKKLGKNLLEEIKAYTLENALNEFTGSAKGKPWNNSNTSFDSLILLNNSSMSSEPYYLLNGNAFKYDKKNASARCLPLYETSGGPFSGGWNAMKTILSKNPKKTLGIDINDETADVKKQLFSIETDIDRIGNIISTKFGSDWTGKTTCIFKWDEFGSFENDKTPIHNLSRKLWTGFKSENGDNAIAVVNGKGILPNNPRKNTDVVPFTSMPSKTRCDFTIDGFKDSLVTESDMGDYMSKLIVPENVYLREFGNRCFTNKKYYSMPNDFEKAYFFLRSFGADKYDEEVINFNWGISEAFADKNSSVNYISLIHLLYFGGTVYLKENKLSTTLDEARNIVYADLKAKIRSDVLKSMSDIFKYWVTNETLFRQSIKNNEIKSFKSLVKNLELDNPSKKDFTKEDFEGKTVEQLRSTFGSNLFKSYISAYASDGYIKLVNRFDSQDILDVTKFLLTGCAFVKYSFLPFRKDERGTFADIRVNAREFRQFMSGAIKALQNEAKNVGNDEGASYQISQAKDPSSATIDIRVGIYRYCKLLYDKWLAGLTEEEFQNKWTKDKFFDEDSSPDGDQYFHFIDCYYNKVGQRVPINLGDLCVQLRNCMTQGQYSLLSLLSDMYANNKMQFLCVQNFKSLAEGLETLFDPVPYLEMEEPKRNPNFIVLYPYESSSKLEMESSEYVNDAFMINKQFSSVNRWPEALKARSLNTYDGYSIPAFGVTYGKMYQSYFTGFDVSMTNPTVTEQSIKAMFQIASQNNEGEAPEKRESAEYVGQDLYTIYSNNSYDCTVTMMGCPWIQPLMYFCLNNVPMFRGTYQIINVTHRLEPGNMTTTFKGVRMANTSTRIVREIMPRAHTDKNDNGGISLMNRLASVDNDCEYKVYPLIYGSGDLSGFVNAPKTNEAEVQDALIVMGYFMAHGFTKEAAAGICGNIWAESEFDINIVEDTTKSEKGYGLCQWTYKPRRDMLFSRCGSKPDLKCQLDFCIAEWNCEGETKGNLPGYGDHQCGSKALLQAAKTPEKAAEIVCWEFEKPGTPRLEIRKNKARKYYDAYGPTAIRKPENGKESDEVSPLANGFLDAINRTAQATSSVNGIVTVDPNKSKKNSLWIVKANNGCNLSQMFDIILNAYYDKVESIHWVTSQNTLGQEPIALKVDVKEGATSKLISISDSSLKVLNVYEGLPDNFYLSIAKKYGFRKNSDNSCSYDSAFDTEVRSFRGHSNIVCEKAKITSCNEVMSSLGVGGVAVNGFIGNWNVGKFVERLYYWQKKICSSLKEPRLDYGGCKRCTAAVNRALRDSELGTKYWANEPWGVYDKMKASDSVFTEIDGGTSPGSEHEFKFSRELQVGDICVMWYRRGQKTSMHTCAYDGRVWISDYIQNRCRQGYSETIEWHLFRHIGEAKIES